MLLLDDHQSWNLYFQANTYLNILNIEAKPFFFILKPCQNKVIQLTKEKKGNVKICGTLRSLNSASSPETDKMNPKMAIFFCHKE